MSGTYGGEGDSTHTCIILEAYSIQGWIRSKKTTMKFQPDDVKLWRMKDVDMTASYVVAFIETLSNFGLKIRIQKIGRNKRDCRQ